MAWLWLPGIETRFNLLLVFSKLARALIVKRASDGTKPSNPPITSSHALVEIPENVLHKRHPPFEVPPEPPPPEPPGAAWSTWMPISLVLDDGGVLSSMAVKAVG